VHVKEEKKKSIVCNKDGACDLEEIIEDGCIERPWDLEESMEGGGIEACDPNLRTSRDGNSLLARMAIKEVAAFSFCDLGNKSVFSCTYGENRVGTRSTF
jgi:hypothetical protein